MQLLTLLLKSMPTHCFWVVPHSPVTRAKADFAVDQHSGEPAVAPTVRGKCQGDLLFHC